ncbi:MAG: allantoicase [bacterium]
MTSGTDFSQRWVNLASSKLGAAAIVCSDDFFAPMNRMLKEEPAVFIEDKYDDHGKWMDGWESRRKRTSGNDWCIVKLARAGVIHGIEVETTHFTGNYAPAASVEACFCDQEQPSADSRWTEVLGQSALKGDASHSFNVSNTQVFTHVRLNIYPDGGIARLRIYAEPSVDWEKTGSDELIDLAAALNGGVALACNDQHYGHIRNLLAPDRGVNMGDGWETRRRREPGNDWVIIALAHPGIVKQIEIDTAHFKGNYPDRVDIRGALLEDKNATELAAQSEKWGILLPESKMNPDHIHLFDNTIVQHGPISHIRMNIYPDGGISRLRLYSQVDLS